MRHTTEDGTSPRRPDVGEPARWSRRAVLGAVAGTGAAGLLAGCSLFSAPTPSPPPPDPLEPLLNSTRALVARYEHAIAVYPELTDRLLPLHATHGEHVAALVDVIGRPDLATPSRPRGSWVPPARAPDPTATASEPAGEPGVEEPADVVAALREAERGGRDEAAQACLDASPARAALLGSITAARATHAEVLA